jgi:hypothetical protein
MELKLGERVSPLFPIPPFGRGGPLAVLTRGDDSDQPTFGAVVRVKLAGNDVP